ncbi:pyridoxal phosphate-dependent aminotransferase [Brevibacterium sp. R8603A2]|uniref:MalY/PatB family protein n=1 Tax=Brevibacterium sp. R8603A2 TaxID=2929779 RepID=UPI001FF84897|nr:MalY/PatB family protein [Brevibacterium sp. R8603A2]MCK1804008.1 pyridoxal phosphate-dependent aminotransferase [Brevibacterium sp. R8603A2]
MVESPRNGIQVSDTAGSGIPSAAQGAAVPNPLSLGLDELRQRTSMKWRAHPDDVLPLWVAEMDVRLAPPIAAALHRTIDAGDTGYPQGTAYAEAFSAFARAHWSWNGLAVERTAIVPDVMLGVVEVLRLVTDPGDAVVVNSPVYAPFYAFVTHDGRRIVEAPLGADHRVDLDVLADTFRQVTQGGRGAAYLLSNPHNPTGTVHTLEELTAIAELARAHGVRVVSDEIHAPLVLPGAHFTPYLSVPGAQDAFALMSASKAWNLAGLKAALAIAGEDAAADLARMPEEVSHGPSHLGLIAHTVALREGQEWLAALLQGLDANRALLRQLVDEHLPEAGFREPEGTYLAWLDCSYLGTEPPAAQDGLAVVSDLAGPAKLFLDEARVALSSGHVFGTGGERHVRLNFATSPAILTEAVERMGRVRPLR